MKIETRWYILNRYTVSSFFLLFFIMLFAWGVDSGVFSVIATFAFGHYDGPYTLSEYLSIIAGFELYTEEGFRFIQIIVPVFPALIILPFLYDTRTLPMTYLRIGSYKKTVLSKITKCLLSGCSALFLAFLCYLAIGAALLPYPENPGNEALFSDVFGWKFYRQHMVGYFVVQGFLRFFIFPFVYGLFGIAVSFLTSKKHLCVLVPVAYYTLLSLACACLTIAMREKSSYAIDWNYLAPSYTLMAGARPYINVWLVLAPLLPVLLFSVAVITRDLIKKERRGDVLAVV